MPETRSYADRREYLIRAVTARRRKLRDLAIEYGGGKCAVCSYKKSKRALTFHHLNPHEKDFGLSARGLTRSWAKIVEELNKCVLLCANCHAEVHDGVLQLSREIREQKRRRIAGNPPTKVRAISSRA